MKRILVVEDEPSIALALEGDLRQEGYEVEVVADGDSAARAGRSGKWDLILLDVMLPGKDGFEVCREIRAAGVRTPILLLTARAHEAEKVLGFELGADDYVTKPYSARELRARIKALLRRNRTEAPEDYQFGDFELDFARCELRRAGKPVELTTLEYKLLAAFVKHAGRVLTRDQLLDEVWGFGTHVTDRVVDNQVTNVRKKIEPEPERPRYIVSLRGIGYRFDGGAVTQP
jgi:DNA-binding response OmpR family regulator